MAKRLQRGVFVDWPRYDGFISDNHPFWDRDEMWISKDIMFTDDGLRNDPPSHYRSMNPQMLWWREKLHFPYRNRHNSTYGPNNAKPHIPYSGNANKEYAEYYSNGLPINIFDLSSPYPYDWRTSAQYQFENQGDPATWMVDNQGKIIQGKAYWTLRGVSNYNQNWIAIGFFDRYGTVTFQEMGFIFEDGREYTGKKAYNLFRSQYAIPISINSYGF